MGPTATRQVSRVSIARYTAPSPTVRLTQSHPAQTKQYKRDRPTQIKSTQTQNTTPALNTHRPTAHNARRIAHRLSSCHAARTGAPRLLARLCACSCLGRPHARGDSTSPAQSGGVGCAPSWSVSYARTRAAPPYAPRPLTQPPRRALRVDRRGGRQRPRRRGASRAPGSSHPECATP